MGGFAVLGQAMHSEGPVCLEHMTPGALHQARVPVGFGLLDVVLEAVDDRLVENVHDT